MQFGIVICAFDLEVLILSYQCILAVDIAIETLSKAASVGNSNIQLDSHFPYLAKHC